MKNPHVSTLLSLVLIICLFSVAFAIAEEPLTPEQPQTRSFEYLIDGETIDYPADFDPNRIIRIAILSTNVLNQPSLLIDFEEGNAYYSDDYLFDDIDSARKVTPLTDELKANVLKEVSAADMSVWEPLYETEDILATTDPGECHICFELPEGIVRFEQYGNESGAPKEEAILANTLFAMFW